MVDETTASSGARMTFVPYETRRIVLAEGAQFHNSDLSHWAEWRTEQIGRLEANPESFRSDEKLMSLYDAYEMESSGMTEAEAGAELLEVIRAWILMKPILDFLKNNLGDNFQKADDDMSAQYINHEQRVTYEIELIHSKSQFKTALETEDLIVIYIGHSRYGRGACFDEYPDIVSPHGEFWGNGTSADNGIFRLGYPYIPVPLTDIAHHQYSCAPVAVELPPPNRRDWRSHPKRMHPEGRRRLNSILMPEDLRKFVKPQFASLSHQYWGFDVHGKTHVMLNCGWENSAAAPADLGATDIKCRTFCHFGCSSRKHYRDIVRRPQYKGYKRPRPPTEKLAYFTTAPSNYKTIYWIYFLLSYNRPNGRTHYWDSHEYAKRMANRRLRRERRSFQIY